MTKRVRFGLSATLAAMALLVSGCDSSGTAGGGAPAEGFQAGKLDKTYAGTELKVLLPPWAQMPAKQLQKFTDETGIKVTMESLDFQTLHDKVVTASAAGDAPGDVVEVDASWVGQFGAAGWFLPLQQWLPEATIKAAVGADSFVVRDQRIAVPYNLDFRGTLVNLTLLKKAGIIRPPTTWGEVLTAAKALQDRGVLSHPVGVPLSITEDTSTVWYALIRAAGVRIFDQDGKATFKDSPQTVKSLELLRDLYQQKLIDPGSVSLNNSQVGDLFAAGSTAIYLSASPSALAQYENRTKSQVSGDELRFVHLPGPDDNTGPTIGLQEGLGIPKASQHKEAAAQFIYWWQQQAQLTAMYQDPDLTQVPPQREVLVTLAKQGHIAGGQELLAVVDTIQPVVAGGAPTWYPKFSAAAAATIKSVAIGSVSPQAGVDGLAKQADDLSRR